MGKPATTTTKPNGHTKPVAEPAEDQHLAPAVVPTSLPAAFEADFDEYAGAGTSDRPEDQATPFLILLQKGSPEINDREAAFIPGAEAGMLLNKSTGQLFETDNGPLFVQAFSETCEVQWKTPRGNGFVARHPLDTPLAQQVRLTVNPQKPDGAKLRMLPDNTQLVETAYHYGFLLETFEPVVIALSSTGLSVHKAWNTLLRNKRVWRNGTMKVQPAFNTIVRLDTMWRKKDSNDWYQLKPVDCGFIDPNDPMQMAVRTAAKELYERAKLGLVRPEAPPAEEQDTAAPAAHKPPLHADDRLDDEVPY